jgi:hypothetical protein
VCPDSEIPLAAYCETASGYTRPPGIGTNGVAQAVTQTLQGHYPNYSFGVNLAIPIRNRQAQADMARALLERRQLETQMQQWKNNIAQQVRNANIAVIQARAQIDAARKATVLAQQTLDAEQKKFQLGESTVFLVIQAQRDLTTAEGTEVSARSTYAKALTTFQQQTGTILKNYNVEMSDAVSGHVERTPDIPGSAETPLLQKQQSLTVNHEWLALCRCWQREARPKLCALTARHHPSITTGKSRRGAWVAAATTPTAHLVAPRGCSPEGRGAASPLRPVGVAARYRRIRGLARECLLFPD